MDKKVNKTADFGRMVWLYIKYQLITKSLLFFLVFPVGSRIMRLLLQSTGRGNISSGDFLGFLFNVQGIGMLFLGFALLVLLIGTDVNAFIIMSALMHEGRLKMTARQILSVSIRSLKRLLTPAGFFLMLYIAVVIPLVGIGFTITPMEGFKIPNFITDVIFKNTLYSTLYVVLMSVLTIASVLHLFAFHYILLLNQSVGQGLKNARRLMKAHWKSFLKDFFGLFLAGLIAIVFVLTAAGILLVINAHEFSEDVMISRTIMMWGMFFVMEIIAFLLFMTAPIITHRLTVLFYRYHLQDGDPIVLKLPADVNIPEDRTFRKIKIRTKALLSLLCVIVIGVNLFLAAILSLYFDEMFKTHRPIEIVAHRGGGDLAAENSLAGLEAAIREGVAWSEIDVQRTKDGKYIINHDPTFERVTGDPRKSTDLTLEEIKQLQIRDLFDPNRPSQEVATIEEFLDAAKGRIGLYIELKGSTADRAMVDDVVAMIRERDMLRETAILSLDYALIQYTKEQYPEIDTGFLYFFSIGETQKMTGDILIMEEREATPEKVAEIQKAGKKAVVWTVNTQASIDRFLNSEVDGVITDYVLQVKDGLERRDARDDYEIILDNFLD